MPEYCEVTRAVWPCKLMLIGLGQFPALERLTSVIKTGLYSWFELVVGGNAVERVTRPYRHLHPLTPSSFTTCL
ncbi:hypothetical protein VNO80_12761 [Phaseolus coccineus]|uniref:Uncharacterized protein n=1 Tax=Phaseolus coccineus TaxID=3886 RepID=A0AAN9N5A4_PHACN